MIYETDWLKKWAKFSPREIAFKEAETGREFSYGLLYKQSCRLATELERRFNIQSGDRLAVLATNEIEFLPLFFALQRLGAILVPISFRLTAREISHIIQDSSPKVLLCQRAFHSTLEQIDPKILPEQKWLFDGDGSLTQFIHSETELFHANSEIETIRRGPHAWEVAMNATPESNCLILYTSGTTGAPKGALISHGMLFWNSVNTTSRLNINQSDVSVSFLPFFHTGAWNVLLTPFVHRGAKTVLLKKFEPDRILDICESERVTILFGVPTTLDMIHQSPRFKKADLKSVRYAVTGGEPMPVELIKAWQEKGIAIRQGFGLTEFGPNVFSLNEEDSIRKIGSIGFPNFYIDVKVVDDSGREVAVGETGELLLRGPMCTPGYWNNPIATSELIRGGWLLTGDLVRQDDEGYFYVAGRKKDMIKSGGENVYPVEIERVLSTHPAIREVAVVGVKDEKWGEVGKAFISLKPNAELGAAEVLQFCTNSLAKFKIPKYVEFLPELPKGDSGKILKRLLRN